MKAEAAPEVMAIDEGSSMCGQIKQEGEEDTTEMHFPQPKGIIIGSRYK